MHTTTPAADPTRNSLVDAIARKVEFADRETDPTAKARLEGSIGRMVADLDADDAKRFAHVPATHVLEALSRGASAIRSRSHTDMRSARLALDAQLDRRLYGNERYRIVRMIQGIERRLARA